MYSHRQSNGDSIPVLENLNFSLKNGEFIVILGESGCGKSTILELMAGLISPTSGRILIDGEPLMDTNPEIALLFQESTLLPWKNVKENISFGCKLRKDYENLDARVGHYMRMMGLQEYGHYYPQELSVGMSKRVDLARALVGNPKALLLDEPFAPLDYYNKMRLQRELLSIWKKEKILCVFVTHDIEEALHLGQKIMIMGNNPGRIELIQDVPLAYPRNPTDQKFIEIKKELLNQFGLISQYRENEP